MLWRKWNTHTLLLRMENGIPLWKIVWQALEMLNIKLYDQEFHSWVYNPEK
jgi:hypothetical protein